MDDIIASMLEEDGIYIAGDASQPDKVVPLFVRGGKVYSMRTDEALNPDRFIPGTTFAGPYWSKPAGTSPEATMPIETLLKIAGKSLPKNYNLTVEASEDGIGVILEYHVGGSVIAMLMDDKLSLRQQIKMAQVKAAENPFGLTPAAIDQVPGNHPLL